MPKISFYENNEFTKNADPKTWAIGYPVKVKDINSDYVLGVNISPSPTSFVIYGVFKKDTKVNDKILNGSQIVSAIEIEECPGIEFNLDQVKKVCVIHNIATHESERGKGFARILYKFLLEKYKVVFSDIELFTDAGKESRTLSIWKKFLPTIGTVLNYDAKTKQYTHFDPSASESTRFVVVSDGELLKTMMESFSKWVKSGVSKAAMTSMLAMPLVSAGYRSPTTVLSPPYPEKMDIPAAPPRADGKSPLAPYDAPKPPEIPKQEEPKNHTINVNIIADLESGNNKYLGRTAGGATGICQLKKEAWDEAVKSLYGNKGISKYPYAQYATHFSLNKRISNQYYNVVLPKHLDAFDVPITVETLLASYNCGSTRVKRAIEHYGSNWLKHLPNETRSYVERYKNIENSL